MQNGNEVGVSQPSKNGITEIFHEDKCVAVVEWTCTERIEERVQQQRTPSPHRDMMTSGNASNSNVGGLNNANTSKLLQLNQQRFEDYLVQTLNESLMKKSKLLIC